MHFHVKVKDSFKAKDIARFLRQLLRQVAGHLVVFLDGVRGLRKAMRRIQRRPDLVRACFRRTKLPRRDVEMLLNQAIGP